MLRQNLDGLLSIYSCMMLLAKKKNSRLHVTSTFARHFTLPIVRQPSGRTFPNMPGTGGAADPRVKAAVHMMKAHPTLSLPQAMWMAKFSESECKNRTMQMRVRRAHLAQMPIVGTDIDVAGMPTMSSLSTQEGTMTETSIPAVSNASSAVATALFPAPRSEEPPRPTAQAKQKDRCNKLETLLKWHNVPKAHKEKKPAMIGRWATIWEGGLKPPFFEAWTDVDKAKLEELKAMDIEEDGAEEGAEHIVNVGEMDAV